MSKVAKEVVHQIRFTGDKQLQETLLKDRSLKRETDAMLKDQTKHAKKHLRSLLGQSLRVSLSSSPIAAAAPSAGVLFMVRASEHRLE